MRLLKRGIWRIKIKTTKINPLTITIDDRANLGISESK
jgi:hypothetical protein